MLVRRFVRQLQYSMIGALFLMGASPSRALAQDAHSHALTPQKEMTPAQKANASALGQP